MRGGFLKGPYCRNMPAMRSPFDDSSRIISQKELSDVFHGVPLG
jgi:hypothetical protein